MPNAWCTFYDSFKTPVILVIVVQPPHIELYSTNRFLNSPASAQAWHRWRKCTQALRCGSAAWYGIVQDGNGMPPFGRKWYVCLPACRAQQAGRSLTNRSPQTKCGTSSSCWNSSVFALIILVVLWGTTSRYNIVSGSKIVSYSIIVSEKEYYSIIEYNSIIRV